ncbi:putative acyl-CoA-binding protein [Wilcoxina mikolae CBS 423.85]|nr:putative acyl-CoA-binding protein [Wilcoxina mikolae CBS 423.85]
MSSEMDEFKPSAEFQTAADTVKKLKQEPKELSTIYALYKQVTLGDLDPEKTPRPSLTRYYDRAKWDARKKLIGKPREEAQQEYIDLVNSLVETVGIREEEEAAA